MEPQVMPDGVLNPCPVGPYTWGDLGDGLPWGLLLPEDRRLLRKYARGEVLEIGAYRGCSTCCLAAGATFVLSVDPHYQGSRREYLWTVRGLPNVIPVHKTSAGAKAGGDIHGFYDVVFVDGDHSREGVEIDTRIVVEHTRPAAIVIYHDYQHPSTPGVTQVVDDLLSGRYGGAFRVVERANFMAVIERTA